MPEMTFRGHAERAGLSEAAVAHVCRERHWTGDEMLRQVDYEAVLAETPPPPDEPGEVRQPEPARRTRRRKAEP